MTEAAMVNGVPRTYGAMRDFLATVAAKFNELRIAAVVCDTNFRWIIKDGARPVPFLDTDIIYGVTQDMLVRSIAEELDPATATGTLNVNEIVGPNTIRYFLSVMDEFCLPEGTIDELVIQHRHTSNRVAQWAKGLCKEIDQKIKALEARRTPADYTLRPHVMRKQLQEELSRRAAGIDELDLVNSLMSRATPDSDLVDSDGPREAKQAFRATLRHLTAMRPEKERKSYRYSNYCDAYNVATVVHVFHSEADKEGRKVAPVLVSATDPILRSARDLEQRLFPDIIDHPKIVSGRTYFAISEGLLEETERRYEVVIDRARNLERDAREIDRRARELAERVEGILAEQTDVKPSDDEILEGWEILQCRFEDFYRKWAIVIRPAEQQARVDATELVDQLLSPGISKRLSGRDPKAVREAAEALVRRLRDCCGALSVMEKALPMNAIPVKLHGKGGEPRRVGGFEIAVQRADYALLSEVAGTQGEVPGMEGCHEFRVVVTHPYISDEAVLAVDTWRRTEESARKIRILWRHNLDFGQVYKDASDLLVACCAGVGASDNRLSFRLLAEGNEHGGECSVEEGLDGALGAMMKEKNREYFELALGGFIFVADLKAICAAERQAGLVLEEHRWSRNARRVMARVVSRSHGVELEEDVATRLLKELMYTVRTEVRPIGGDDARDK